MALHFDVPTPLDYFRALVHDDDHFPLLEAAASIAQDEYPVSYTHLTLPTILLV